VKCRQFKEIYQNFIKHRDSFIKFTNDPPNESLYEDWCEHSHTCPACSDWKIVQKLKENDIDWKKYPCVHLAYRSMAECEQHSNPWDCPNNVVVHDGKKNFGIPIRTGEEGSATSMIGIEYCPWCGKKIPEKPKLKLL